MTELNTEKQAPGGQLAAGLDGPRACGKYDLAGVLDLCNLVMRVLDTPPGKPAGWPTIGYGWPHVYNHGNLDNIRLIAHEGEIVSSVGIYTTEVRTPRGTISVGGINCFVTHPDHRRSGLGGMVLTDAHAKMRADGHHMGLLSTLIPDYYRKYGWEPAGRQRTFRLDRGNIAHLPDPVGLDLTDEWRPAVEQLLALHDREPMRATRTRQMFELLVERKFERVFVARRDSRLVAYAAMRQMDIREYGGQPDDVAALLRAVFAETDDPSTSTSTRTGYRRPTIEMTVTTPDSADGLPGLLLDRGVPNTLGYMGLIVLLDAPGLLEALDIRDVELEPRDSGWRVSHRGRSLDLTGHDLVKLVFGPERYPDFAPDVFPIDFYQWPADRA